MLVFSSNVTIGVVSGARKVEEFRLMISFKSVGGISEGYMYRERSSKANSEKDKFFHFDSQSRGNEEISSGMKRPPSAARPFKTTSLNESCRYLAVVSTSIASIDYSLRRNLPTLRGSVERYR
jgi:hypothetical protein